MALNSSLGTNYELFFYIAGKGSNWKHVEGYTEGQTATCTNKFGNKYSAFAHPIDVHLACRGVQGWPKIHIEIYAVNALSQCWPVGYIYILDFDFVKYFVIVSIIYDYLVLDLLIYHLHRDFIQLIFQRGKLLQIIILIH